MSKGQVKNVKVNKDGNTIIAFLKDGGKIQLRYQSNTGEKAGEVMPSVNISGTSFRPDQIIKFRVSHPSGGRALTCQ